MIKQKIILIDFCETIVSIQTAEDFIFFCMKDSQLKYKLLEIIKNLLSFKLVMLVLGRLGINFNFKKIAVFFLKGINEGDLYKQGENYAHKILINKLNSKVILKIKEEYGNDRKIIVSGGFVYYIKPLMETLKINIDNFLCTKLATNKKKILNGKIYFDCMEENKKIALEYLNIFPSVDKELITFTDSISDLPLIKISDKTHFIYENNTWYNISKD